MTQGMLFVWLTATALFTIAGVKELGRKQYAMGALLVCVPIAGWISLWLGR